MMCSMSKVVLIFIFACMFFLFFKLCNVHTSQFKLEQNDGTGVLILLPIRSSAGLHPLANGAAQ